MFTANPLKSLSPRVGVTGQTDADPDGTAPGPRFLDLSDVARPGEDPESARSPARKRKRKQNKKQRSVAPVNTSDEGTSSPTELGNWTPNPLSSTESNDAQNTASSCWMRPRIHAVCHYFTTHRCFEPIVFATIVVNSVALSSEDPLDPHRRSKTLYRLDLITTSMFVVEFVLRALVSFSANQRLLCVSVGMGMCVVWSSIYSNNGVRSSCSTNRRRRTNCRVF